MNTKPASILLEVLVSLIIISVVVISSMFIYKDFFEIKHEEFNNEIHKIELRNSKYFLSKNIKSPSDINHLSYTQNQLFYKGSLLLDKVSSYEIKTATPYIHMNICLDKKICQEWVLLL